jgi:hypothetical protein
MPMPEAAPVTIARWFERSRPAITSRAVVVKLKGVVMRSVMCRV